MCVLISVLFCVSVVVLLPSLFYTGCVPIQCKSYCTQLYMYAKTLCIHSMQIGIASFMQLLVQNGLWSFGDGHMSCLRC